MKLAILFTYYKDVEVCINRLKLFRKYNKDVAIYGLYGGNKEKEQEFEQRLKPYLDDNYFFDKPKKARWKWLYFDLMINAWFEDRGRDFDWDTLVVTAWDMLMFGNVYELLPGLQKDQVYVSGTRPVREVYGWWNWTKPVYPWHNIRYHRFAAYLKDRYDYDGELLCSQAVVMCFPKTFLEQYSLIDEPERGYLEYRMPTFAKVFGFPLYDGAHIKCWWSSDPKTKAVPKEERIFHAEKNQVPLQFILKHLNVSNGPRIFHPFRQIFPFNLSSDFKQDFCRNIDSGTKKEGIS